MKKQQLRVENLNQNRNYKVRLSVHSNNQWIDATKSFNVQTPRFLEDSMSAYTTSSYISRDYQRVDKFTDGVFNPGTLKTTTETWTVKSVSIKLFPEYKNKSDFTKGVDLAKSQFTFEIVFNKNLPKDLAALSGFTGVLGVLLNGGGKLPAGSIKGSKITFKKTWSSTIPELSSGTWKAFNSSPSINYPLTARQHGYFDDPSFNELYSLSKDPDTTANKVFWSSANLTVTDTSIIGAKYTAPTTTSTYTNTCSIVSKISANSIFDSLYWTDNVKDYIYFFIADDEAYADKRWWYFENTNDIKPATVYQGKVTKISGNKGSITIKDRKVVGGPPTKTSADLTDRTTQAKCTYFSGSEVGKNDFGIKTIYVRFAIARYVKQTNGNWKGTWLPGASSESKMLSTTEALSGK